MTRVPHLLPVKKEPLQLAPQDDDTTVARHVNLLQTEYKKKHPNKQVLKELMEKTYHSRRKSITSKEVKETIVQYPCLKDYDEVSMIQFFILKTTMGNQVDGCSHFLGQEGQLISYPALSERAGE